MVSIASVRAVEILDSRARPTLAVTLTLEGNVAPGKNTTYWLDTGTPEQYIQAQTDLLDGRRGAPVDGVDASAQVDPAAVVVRSVVGPEAVVEAGATVEGSVLLRGALVRRGAVVTDSVVGAAAEVAPGAWVVGGTIVGDGEVVATGTRLDGARVPVPAS